MRKYMHMHEERGGGLWVVEHRRHSGENQHGEEATLQPHVPTNASSYMQWWDEGATKRYGECRAVQRTHRHTDGAAGGETRSDGAV